jgi:hypothetical protein
MAMQGCLGQNKVVCGGVRLFATEQGYPRQNNVVHGETTLSAAKQGYLRQNKVVYRKQHYAVMDRPSGS